MRLTRRVLQGPLVWGLRCNCAVFKTAKWGGGALLNLPNEEVAQFQILPNEGVPHFLNLPIWGGGALFKFVERVEI